MDLYKVAFSIRHEGEFSAKYFTDAEKAKAYCKLLAVAKEMSEPTSSGIKGRKDLSEEEVLMTSTDSHWSIKLVRLTLS